jgi:hypothetical protein
VKLGSVELVNALSAKFEQLNVLTQTSVNINQNVVKAELGNFLLFASFLDTFYIDDGSRPSDKIIFDFLKPLLDDADITDIASKGVIKAFNDAGYVTDSERLQFVKNAFETITTSDPYYFEFAKALNDSVSGVGDQAFLFTKKVQGETPSVSESISLGAGLGKSDSSTALDEPAFSVGKPLLDDSAVVDAHTLAFAKILSDQVTSTEDHVVIFTKKAADEVVATLDLLQKNFGTAFDDAASLSEAHSIATSKPIAEIIASAGDQAFLFAKKVSTDPVGAVDDDVLAFAKALSDHGFISEAIDTLTIGKSLSDVPAASDAINSKVSTKQLSDTVSFTDDVDGTASILDDQEMQFTKIKTDVAAAIDVFERQVDFDRAFADASGVVDNDLLAIGKSLSDTPNTSDSTNMVTGKQIYDIPVASETLAKSLARLRSDSALLGDATVVSPGKVLLDLASSTDTGSLRSQGYSDFTYFAEDFVGASTTF